MAQTLSRVTLKDRTILLVGTAHISSESIKEVRDLIAQEKPERVCVEIDEGRWKSMTEGQGWDNLDIGSVLREGRGFLLLSNLALAGFQRRMGAEVGVKSGEEMVAAVHAAKEAGIPCSFCDREVQVTLKRAWAKSGLWNKAKLIASLIESAFSKEKLSVEEIEKLKERSELEEMMAELADFLPSVKEVLIDERDRYLAARIFESREQLVLAVIGAGHLRGVEDWLFKFDRGEALPDTSEIDKVPLPSIWGKVLAWSLPTLIVGLIVVGFFRSGQQAAANLLHWVLLNGSLAALGSALCLAHPLTILVSFLGAPIATLNPFIGVGLFAGLSEAFLRKPKVADLHSLADDVTSFRGFYKNRVTHILLVFFLSSLGGAVGNFISIPVLASKAVGG